MDQAFIDDMPDQNTEHDQFILSDFGYVGKENILRTDGYEKASGKAIYTRDVSMPGMLYAKMLSSPYASCVIKSIDTSAAQALLGVRDVMVYDESLPMPKSFYGATGYHPQSFTADFEGQPMGCAIAADSEEIADQAIRLLKVEYEERPFILDATAALQTGATIASPELYPENNIIGGRTFTRGDVTTGFAAADKIINYNYNRTELVTAGVEAHSTVASWNGDYLDIYVHYQWPGEMTKMWVQQTFGTPSPKIHVTSYYSGATFGVGCSPQWCTLYTAIMLAKRTGRPVKCIMDGRMSHFMASGDDTNRVSFKIGCKNNGEITAVDINIVFTNEQEITGAEHLWENTKIPNLNCNSNVAKVNRGVFSAFRSERRPGTMISNQVFDVVAAELGLDPTKVASLNDGAETMDMNQLSEFKKKHGFPDIDSLAVCLEQGKQAIDWDNKWHAPGTKKLDNGKMHGMGFAWDHEWDGFYGGAQAGIMMHEDGKAQILGIHTDPGVNGETAFCQIAADEIGLKYEDVSIRPFHDVGFEFVGCATSTGICANGFVVRKAARQIKQKLLEMATTTGDQLKIGYGITYLPFPGKTPDDLDIKDGIIFEKANPDNSLAISEMYRKDWPIAFYPAGYCWKSHKPIFAFAYRDNGVYDSYGENRRRLSRQAHFVEVEVDIETGAVDIINVVTVNDVGKAMNPRGAHGQQYGGDYMAMGRGMSEEAIYDPSSGVKLNANLIDYKILLMNDVGPIVPILVESSLGYGPYGAEGIGECCADVAMPLVANAVFNAIGHRITELPVSPERVLAALQGGTN
jgi:CO/xanthine dehydrogenase Mo-binding subunit